MRVWDTLRAVQAVRELAALRPDQISLAARGEMTAVAIYAALLDGRVNRLVLESPPPTQNAPSQRDGRGPALEMLGCLRLTDLPQVAGLLWPAELVCVATAPDTFAWAEALYQRLGPPGRFRRLKNLEEWQPA